METYFNRDRNSEYLRWEKEFSKQLAARTKMTCIIGVRCQDGILLAGDTRVLRGLGISHQYKIIRPHEIPVVYASSGTTGLMDIFIKKVEVLIATISSEKLKLESMDMFTEKLEDIILEIHQRYVHRSPSLVLDVFVGYNSSETKAELYHIYPIGFSENVKEFDIIGSGRSYVLPLIQSLYQPDITLNEMSTVCCYVLGLINELQIDASVGGLPQIVWIKDKPEKDDNGFLEWDKESIKKIIKGFKNEDNKGKLSNVLWNIFEHYKPTQTLTDATNIP